MAWTERYVSQHASASDSNGGTNDTTDAWATPGYGASQLTTGQRLNIKYEGGTPYTLTTTTAGAGGPLAPTINIELAIEGYETTAGDLGGKPIIDAGSQTAFTFITLDGAFNSGQQLCRNIKVDGQDGAGITGFSCTVSYRAEVTFQSCVALDCVTGFSSTRGYAVDCLADGGTTGFSSSLGRFNSCEARNATGNGFNASSTDVSFIKCLARDNNVGFNSPTNYVGIIYGCTAEGNTSHGFSMQSYSMVIAIDCLATNNGGYGFNTRSDAQALINCAGYNNTSGNTAHTPQFYAFTALTGDPYEAVGSDDYRPNNTAGAGADLRGAGIGISSQITNRDIGAVQHEDPAGGGGTTVKSPFLMVRAAQGPPIL